MSTVIKVENLSKQYRLGLIGSGTLREDLEGWWYRIRGKEDPTIMLGEVNDRTTVGKSNYVWALRDINFEVQQGEVLGIIGKNGAGKSTLLKLLSRVTAPTTGHIKAKGRIASLLEVGTGFHPELTGRENIYLNGAIMGMKKHEITRKLDEIIDFAGVERYLETPVKRYSSGMYVRLAFAVAAHLEPEILIVDEVLAVGDAEFQKKALGKMKEVSTGSGRTVLFVSHNMASIQNLCDRCIVLDQGSIGFQGESEKAISYYLADSDCSNESDVPIDKRTIRNGNGSVIFADCWIESMVGDRISQVLTGQSVYIVFKLLVRKSLRHPLDIGFSFSNADSGTELAMIYSSFQKVHFGPFESGEYLVKCLIRDFSFVPGRISIGGRITCEDIECDAISDLKIYEVSSGDYYSSGFNLNRYWGAYLFRGEWMMHSNP